MDRQKSIKEREEFIKLVNSLDNRVRKEEITRYEAEFIIKSITKGSTAKAYLYGLNKKIDSITEKESKFKYKREVAISATIIILFSMLFYIFMDPKLTGFTGYDQQKEYTIRIDQNYKNGTTEYFFNIFDFGNNTNNLTSVRITGKYTGTFIMKLASEINNVRSEYIIYKPPVSDSGNLIKGYATKDIKEKITINDTEPEINVMEPEINITEPEINTDFEINETINEKNTTESGINISLEINETINETNTTEQEINETAGIIDFIVPFSTINYKCIDTCNLDLSPYNLSIIIEVFEGEFYLEKIIYTKEITNQAPVQIKEIPDLYNDSIINLSEYFNDPEEETLYYDLPYIEGAELKIDGSILSVVSVTQKTNGYVYVTDGKEVITSNIFNIYQSNNTNTILQIPQEILDALQYNSSVRIIVKTKLESTIFSSRKDKGGLGTAGQDAKNEKLVIKKVLLTRNNNPIEIKREIGKIKSLIVDTNSLNELIAIPEIEEIILDTKYYALISDVLEITKINDVQTEGYSGLGERICVLDTGYNDASYSGYNFVDNNDNYSDVNGHGTSVVYPLINAAQNSNLIIGKVIDDSGVGYASDIIAGLDYCVSQNASIISMSVGGGSSSGYCDDDLVAQKVNELNNAGILVVVATGNDGSSDSIKIPSCASGALRVGASTKSSSIASFSNFNNATLLVTPGENILTKDVSGNDVFVSGTSMSVPFVSGTAALILENKTLNPQELKELLIHTGDLINYSGRQFAQLNAYNALTRNITNNLSVGNLSFEYNISNFTISSIDAVNLISPSNSDSTNSPVFFVSNVYGSGISNATLYTNESGWAAKETRWNGEVNYNDTDLRVLYHFNNESAFGENDKYIFDWSGNGINLSCPDTCPPYNNSGKFDLAQYKQPTDNDFSAPDSDYFTGWNYLTVIAWVNPLRNQSAQGGEGGEIVSKRNDGDIDPNGNYEMFYLAIGTDNAVWLHVVNSTGDGSQLVSGSANSTLAGRWTMIAGRYNGTHADVFVNGVKNNTDEFTLNGPLLDSDQPLYIGWNDYNGTIDEVAIWNRSLSDAEILALYNYSRTSFYPVFQNRMYNYSNNITWNVLGVDNLSNSAFALNNFTFLFNPVWSVGSYVTPTVAYTNDVLIGYCQGNTSDASTTLKYYYQWFRSTNLNASGSVSGIANGTIYNVNNVSAISTTKGESWILSCRVEQFNGNSSWTNSSATTILNTAPVIISTSIIPTPTAYIINTLLGYCNASDIDNDNLTYYYTWFLNGVLNTSGSIGNFTQATQINVANISNTSLAVGQNWTLECMADDGIINSTAMNSSITTIINTPPSIVSSRIVPSPTAYTNDKLLGYCNATDVDNEILYYNYTWYNNDVVNISGTIFKEGGLSNGQLTSCGIRANDSRLLCWGNNNYGQFGNGTVGGYATTPQLSGIDQWDMVSTGHYATCGIKTSDEKVYCWGRNYKNILGNFSLTYDANYPTPQPILSSDQFIYVNAQGLLACGIRKSDSRVVCWGDNTLGQAGRGYSGTWENPGVTSDTGAYLKVITGNSAVCGIRANDSRGLCWGSGSLGRLGIGNLNYYYIPTLINYSGAVTHIASIGGGGCLLTQNDSRIMCWGRNTHGEVGVGDYVTTYYSPRYINSTASFSSLAVGYLHTCGVRLNDSRVECWGSNTNGELGNGTIGGTNPNPKEIVDNTEFRYITAYLYASSGLRKNDSRVMTWGIGASGLLGNGGTSDSATPVLTSDTSAYKYGFRIGQELLVSLIFSTQTRVGDSWILSCQASDYTNTSSWMNSTPTTIINTPPAITSPIILPNPATVNDTLTLTFSQSDADGDTVSNVTDWRINGQSIAVLNMPFNTNVSTTTTGAVKDYSTYGNNGTLINDTSWIPVGKLGGGYILDGLNDYISIPYSNSITYNGGNMTISVWINPSVGELDDGRILSKPWNSGGEYNYVLTYTSSQTIQASVAGNTSDYLDSVVTASRGSWHHILLTVDSNKNMIIYIDGILVANKTHIVSNWTPVSGDNSLPLALGTLYPYGEGWAGISSFSFNGTIDEVQIFNRSLSPDQIQAIYQAGLNNHSVDIIVSNETRVGENWTTCVTASDSKDDSTTVCSNNITIGICGTINTANTVYTLDSNISINDATCFNIQASNVTINCAGYSITGNNIINTYGIYTSANGATIENCTITGFYDQIYAGAVNNLTIYKNVLNTTYNSNSARGIFLSGTLQNTRIINNSIVGPYGSGLYVSSSAGLATNWVIANNTIIHAGDSTTTLHIYQINRSTITGNTISSSGVSSRAAYLQIYESNVTNNYISSSTYVVLEPSGSVNTWFNNNTALSTGWFPALYGYTTYCNFTNNNFTGNNGLGLQIYSNMIGTVFSNNYIQGNNFAGITFGTITTSNLLFINNTIVGVGVPGVYTYQTTGSYNILFKNNTIRSNTVYAIQTNSQSYNITFLWNNISGSKWVNNSGTQIYFNDSTSGNFYHLSNGSAAWNVFNITSNNGDIWADVGAAIPFNSTNTPGNWTGIGGDWHPYTLLNNYKPVMNTSTILPSPAYINDTLLGYCNATDQDTTNIYYHYTWYLNGVLNVSGSVGPYAQGIILNVANISNSSLVIGQNWTLECIADDLTSNSTAMNSSVTTIQNQLPVVSNVILNATSLFNYSSDNLTLYFTQSDIDGDLLSNVTDWRRNGQSIAVLNIPFNTNVSTNDTGAVKDYSIYGNNGTLGSGNSSKMPAWTSSGKIGGSYTFDGIDDFINFEDILDLGTGNATLTAWVKTTSTVSSGIVGKPHYGSTVARYSLFLVDDGTISLITQGSGGNIQATSTGTVNNGQWHFVVGVIDRVNGNTVYIDGQPDGSASGNTVGQNWDIAKNFTIGTYDDGNRYFNGTIDEVQVFNRSLSAEQIYAIYQAGFYNHSVDMMVSNETVVGENWTACVTPSDGYNDGATECSNNVTIRTVECGTLSAANTIYTLTKNISVSSGTCFTVSASNVTIDCNGYSINGTGANNSYGVYTTQGYTTVKNCNIRNFDIGIYLNGGLFSNITNNTINITSTNYNWPGGAGIFTYNGNTSAEISNNNIHATANDGLYILSTSNVVKNNNVTSTGAAGAIDRGYNIILNNSFKGIGDIRQMTEDGCTNTFINNTGTNDMPIVYYNASVNISNQVNSSIIFCNADGSRVINITAQGITISYSKDIVLENITVNGSFWINGLSRNITVKNANISVLHWQAFWINSCNDSYFENIIGNGLYMGSLSFGYTNNNILKNSIFTSGNTGYESNLFDYTYNSTFINNSFNVNCSSSVYCAAVRLYYSSNNYFINSTFYNPIGPGLTFSWTATSTNNYFENNRNNVNCLNTSYRQFYSIGSQNISSKSNTGWWPDLTASSATTQATTRYYNGTQGGLNADLSYNASYRYWYNNNNQQIPVVTVSNIVPSPTAYRNDTLRGYCTATDADFDTLIYHYTWFLNGVLNTSGSIGNFTQATQINVANISNTSLAVGQNWTLECMADDSFSNSTALNSSITTIKLLNMEKVILKNPTNVNTTIHERRPLFEWYATNNANYYEINITSNNCPNIFGNVTYPQLNFTPTSELCLKSEGYNTYYTWTVRACGTDACGNWSNQWNFTIEPFIDITLTTDSIYFGTLIQGEEKDTSTGDPPPFVVRNDGNVLIDMINISVTQPVWQSVALGTEYFQAKANISEPGSFNTTGSLMEWFNLTANNNPIIRQLNYSDTNDTAAVDIRIKVPTTEPSGSKNQQLLFYLVQTP